jgi:spermidine/putrescine-binding protein
MWFDTLAIPADAPNKEAAHKFIEYLLLPCAAFTAMLCMLLSG